MPLSRNLVTLTSWNPLGLSRPVMGLHYLSTYKYNLGTLNSWSPLGHSRPAMGLLYLFTYKYNLGTLTSWNPLGLSRPVMGLLYLYLFTPRICGSGSSVGIVTDYGLDDPGSNPGGDEIFRTRQDRPWGSPSLL